MKKLLLLALIGFSALTLTACAKTPSQGVTDTTVTVGNTAATSGLLAFVGVPFITAMES
jgi:hypothetical protein